MAITGFEAAMLDPEAPGGDVFAAGLQLRPNIIVANINKIVINQIFLFTTRYPPIARVGNYQD
jgi:hypothetical protein